MSLLYNVNRDPNSEVGEPKHFMPYLPYEEEVPPSPEEIRSVLRAAKHT